MNFSIDINFVGQQHQSSLVMIRIKDVAENGVLLVISQIGVEIRGPQDFLYA